MLKQCGKIRDFPLYVNIVSSLEHDLREYVEDILSDAQASVIHLYYCCIVYLFHNNNYPTTKKIRYKQANEVLVTI